MACSVYMHPVPNSPFQPPQEPPESTPGSWTYLAARVVAALGVLAYGGLLGTAGALGVFGFVYGATEDAVPQDVFLAGTASAAALGSVAFAAAGCAVLVVFFRGIALRSLLAFAVYAVCAVLPLAVWQAGVTGSVQESARIIAVGSLGPMLCVMAYGALRVLADRET